MNRLIIIFLLLLTSSGATWAAQTVQSLPPANYDVLAWPRMSVKDFGCFLEKTFGYKDARFNCSLRHYQPSNDPCGDDRYYKGPEFPAKLVTKIHPLLKEIILSWEHGELQEVAFNFKQKIESAALKKAFHVPQPLPKNIMSIDVQDCSRDGVCLLIQGFDHMGAGEVDCPSGGD